MFMKACAGAGALMLFAAACATTNAPIETAAIDRTEDLAAFRSEFFEVDRAYSEAARAEAERMLAALEAEAPTLSNAAYEVRIAEIVAKANNGHTLFFPGLWQEKFNRVGVKTLILEEKLYIGAADASYQHLIGAEIRKVEGRNWREVRAALGSYQGGVAQWKDNYLRFYVESPQILHAAGLARDPSRIKISGVDAKGRRFRAVLEGETRPADYQDFALYLPPSRLIELAPQGARPLYLQNAERLYRLEWLPGDIAYIQYKTNSGDDGEMNAISFSQDAAQTLRDRTPSQVILDQRFNSGGDLNYTRDLMRSLPGLVAPGGKIYVITSGKTFSAAISSIGYLKEAGGARVVIVGEPVGDRLEFWAEGSIVNLPQSGAAMLYATERHNYKTGCQEADCHGSIRDHPIRVNSVEPDYLTPLAYAEFAAGRDPAMEKIMALIAGEPE